MEQIIRPTGLMDPPIDVRPVRGQVDDLLQEIRVRAERHERVLVTTLTKKMSEDLTQYYQELGVKVRYLHSDIETLERIEILRDLRRGVFDVLIGINLLRKLGWIYPRCRWWRFWTPTRRAFCDQAARPSRPRAEPRATSTAASSSYAGHRDQLDAAVPERDRAAACDSAGEQRRARHHTNLNREGDRRGPRRRGGSLTTR